MKERKHDKKQTTLDVVKNWNYHPEQENNEVFNTPLTESEQEIIHSIKF